MTETSLQTISSDITVASESVVANMISEPKLWAGKYKSPEELEEAYKNSAKVFNENKELSQKLERLSKAPSEYEMPSEVALREDEIAEIKQIARNANLSQDHFVNLAKEMDDRVRHNLKTLEEAKKSIGDDKLNVIEQYVKDNYPAKLHNVIINNTIKDKEVMDDILKKREESLNSQAPGMASATNGNSQSYDGHKEMLKARQDYQENPCDRTRKKYINMATEVGHERFKK